MRIRGEVFQDLYLAVRKKEDRVYSDEQLVRLPDIDASHIHFPEWKIRKQSADRLISYLGKKQKPLEILEVGCGDGWLAAKLTGIEDANVIGQDINRLEIAQAARVFRKTNLQFTTAELDSDYFTDRKFDIIVFAASLQYFPTLDDILRKAEACLAENGEIHIIDTHFYHGIEDADAAARTLDYYTQLGYPELSAFYFHHRFADFRAFNYQTLYNPHSLINKVRRAGPFYWICIKKPEI